MQRPQDSSVGRKSPQKNSSVERAESRSIEKAHESFISDCVCIALGQIMPLGKVGG